MARVVGVGEEDEIRGKDGLAGVLEAWSDITK
jgi:hypothetical protein